MIGKRILYSILFLPMLVSCLTKTTAGEFDIRKELERLYGGEGEVEIEPQSEFIVRIPQPSDDQEGPNEIVRVLLAVQYREEGEDKFILITGRGPEDLEVHAAMVDVDGAVFRWADQDWQIEAERRSITMMGSYLRAPKGELIQIGPDKHGFLFRTEWMGQGSASETTLIIGVVENTLAVVFEQGTFLHSEVENRTWEYSSTLEYVSENGAEYYDIRVVTSGTKPLNDEITSFEEVQIWRFDGREYVLKK